MHSAPTHGPGCVHTAPCRRPGLAWPCCRPGPTVSQAWPSRVAGLARPCRRRPLPCRYAHACLARCVADRVLRVVSRNVSSRRAPCCPPSVSYRGAYPAVVQHCIVTQPSAKPPSCQDTIVCILTRLANQTARLSRYKNYIVTQLGLNQDKCCPFLVTKQSLCHDTKTLAARAGQCRGRGLTVSQPSYAVSWPLF